MWKPSTIQLHQVDIQDLSISQKLCHIWHLKNIKAILSLMRSMRTIIFNVITLIKMIRTKNFHTSKVLISLPSYGNSMISKNLERDFKKKRMIKVKNGTWSLSEQVKLRLRTVKKKQRKRKTRMLHLRLNMTIQLPC